MSKRKASEAGVAPDPEPDSPPRLEPSSSKRSTRDPESFSLTLVPYADPPWPIPRSLSTITEGETGELSAIVWHEQRARDALSRMFHDPVLRDFEAARFFVSLLVTVEPNTPISSTYASFEAALRGVPTQPNTLPPLRLHRHGDLVWTSPPISNWTRTQICMALLLLRRLFDGGYLVFEKQLHLPLMSLIAELGVDVVGDPVWCASRFFQYLPLGLDPEGLTWTSSVGSANSLAPVFYQSVLEWMGLNFQLETNPPGLFRENHPGVQWVFERAAQDFTKVSFLQWADSDYTDCPAVAPLSLYAYTPDRLARVPLCEWNGLVASYPKLDVRKQQAARILAQKALTHARLALCFWEQMGDPCLDECLEIRQVKRIVTGYLDPQYRARHLQTCVARLNH